MSTRKKQKKDKNKKHRKTKSKGGKSQFDSFQKLGKTVDDFLVVFNIDELSKKNAADYKTYKTFKKNNKFKFVLLPSTIKDNQFSGVKLIRTVENDKGINIMDSIRSELNDVEDDFGKYILGYYNITKQDNRKGVYNKEINVKETIKDNLPAVEEENIERFVNKRFNHL
jgi:hypothetical protein